MSAALSLTRISYRAPFADHVCGEYEPRVFDPVDRSYAVQWVAVRCERCGATQRVPCSSGRPRDKVLKFALLHLHRDPLGNPGSR